MTWGLTVKEHMVSLYSDGNILKLIVVAVQLSQVLTGSQFWYLRWVDYVVM